MKQGSFNPRELIAIQITKPKASLRKARPKLRSKSLKEFCMGAASTSTKNGGSFWHI